MKGNLRSTTLADLHLGVRIGGDAALMKGLLKVQIEHGAIDSNFIEEKTSGYEAMIDETKSTPWKRIVSDSGLTREEIETAGKMLAKSSATIACWAMGLTQHRNGVSVIQEVVNLLLLGGHVGRKGAGFCPVRGHSNVQGDRTVGIWEAPTDAFLDRMEEGLGFTVPRKHGLDVVHTIQAMADDDIDFFRLFAEQCHLRIDELFAHRLGVAAFAGAVFVFLKIEHQEFGIHTLDLLFNLGTSVEGTHDRTHAFRSSDRRQSGDSRANDHDLGRWDLTGSSYLPGKKARK